MRVKHIILSAALLSRTVCGRSTPPSDVETRSEASGVLSSLTERAIANLRAAEKGSHNSTSCRLSNASVRKDWTALSSPEKKSYIAALQCLLHSPSQSDPAFAPGARNRYDDFVAIHINQTLSVHGTGNFLTWHRYFIHAYETALRQECGYTGHQPYWNWFENTDDLRESPLFDGSDTSLGGDGAFFAHNGSLTGANNIYQPSGNGGGCVMSGPLVNMTVHLGPVAPAMAGLAPNPSPDGILGYNPRCLSRDLSASTASTWFTTANLRNITTGAASTSIGAFQDELQGRFGDLFLGMHATGHISVGGEASDLFSSINDPSFLLQHAMVDHVYWIWQALHLDQRDSIAGTITILNAPPSRDALVTDVLDLGVLAPVVEIAEVLDTLGGTPFCYVYE